MPIIAKNELLSVYNPPEPGAGEAAVVDGAEGFPGFLRPDAAAEQHVAVGRTVFPQFHGAGRVDVGLAALGGGGGDFKAEAFVGGEFLGLVPHDRVGGFVTALVATRTSHLATIRLFIALETPEPCVVRRSSTPRP